MPVIHAGVKDQDYHPRHLHLNLVRDYQRAKQLHADTRGAPGESYQRQLSPPKQFLLSFDCAVARTVAMSVKVRVEARLKATPSRVVLLVVLAWAREEVRSGAPGGLGYPGSESLLPLLFLAQDAPSPLSFPPVLRHSHRAHLGNACDRVPGRQRPPRLLHCTKTDVPHSTPYSDIPFHNTLPFDIAYTWQTLGDTIPIYHKALQARSVNR